MSKKVDIDQVMDDCVSIQNQIDGLNLLLIQKKQTLAQYFEHSGKKQLSNDDCVVFISERTNVEYDIDKLLEKLDKELTDQFISKEFTISDWSRFVAFMKSKNISGKELKPYILTKRSIDKTKLSKLYDQKKLTIQDIEGCYEAKVTKSVVLRLKNAKQELNLT